MNQNAFLARLASVTDQDAAAMVSGQALNELAEQITAMPIAPQHRVSLRGRPRTVFLSAVVTAAAVVAAVALAGPLWQAPARRGSHPARLTALIFSRTRGYIDVVIRNFDADPAIYRAEFAAHHLDISLLMEPGSPSIVGTLAMGGGNGVGVLTQPGRCSEPGGGACVIGVRISDRFRGRTQLAFVRPARPGERYETTGLVTARGEAMYRLRYLDQPVGTVLAMLAGRHVTVGDYRFPGADSASARSVPADWYVIGADPWAPGQVALDVSPTLHPRLPVCQPVNGLACPVGTPSPHS